LGIARTEKKEADNRIKVSVKEAISAGIQGAQSSWRLMGLVSGFLESNSGYRTVVTWKTKFNAHAGVYLFELADGFHDTRSSRDLA